MSNTTTPITGNSQVRELRQLTNGIFNDLKSDGIRSLVANDSASGSEVGFILQNTFDPTKRLRIDIASFPTATTRTLTFPNSNGQIVLDTATQTLTNKTLTSPVIAAIINGSATLTLPTTTDVLVGRATVDTLSNKTFVTPTITVRDGATFTLQNTANNTKQARFDLTAISNSTIRTFSLPDVSDTLVTLTATQTLTNKTFTSPTFSTIVNGAATLTLPTTTDVLVGRATVDTLSNKTFSDFTAFAANVAMGSGTDTGQRLQVSGTTDTLATVIITGTSGAQPSVRTVSDQTFELKNISGGGYSFTQIGVGERARFSSAGNLLVGTTSDTGNRLSVSGNTLLTGNLAVNGDSLTTTASVFNLAATGATTVNAFNAATVVNMGSGAASAVFTFGQPMAVASGSRVYAGYFHGDGTNITGIVAAATGVVQDTTSNATYFPVFADASSGSANLRTASTNLTYNPLNRLLTVTGRLSVVGSLSAESSNLLGGADQIIGNSIASTSNPSTTNTGSVIGTRVTMRTSGLQSHASVAGIEAWGYQQSSANVGTLAAVSAVIVHQPQDTAVVDMAIAVHARGPFFANTMGSIAQSYGVRIESQHNATYGPVSWGVYQSGIFDRNYWGGRSLFGQLTDNGTDIIQVTGSSRFTGAVNVTGSLTTTADVNAANLNATSSVRISGLSVIDSSRNLLNLGTSINSSSASVSLLTSSTTVTAFSAATSLTLANTTAATTINVGTGVTSSAATKTINIGSNGGTGSTTNINIGVAPPSAGASFTTVFGRLNAQFDLRLENLSVQEKVRMTGDNSYIAWHNSGGTRIGYIQNTLSDFRIVGEVLPILISAPTVQIAGSTTIVGDFTATGGIIGTSEIRSTSGSFQSGAATASLFSTTVTNASLATVATTLTLGATSGTATIRNATTVVNQLNATGINVAGNDLTTTSSGFNLINTNAVNVNFAQAATNLVMGALTGTTTIRNPTTAVNLLSAQSVSSSGLMSSFTRLSASGSLAPSMATATGQLGSIEVFADSSNAAFMSFHRAGVFASYFGLDSDNQWKVGGWSQGAVAFPILHSNNFTSYAPSLTGGGASGTWNININGSSGSLQGRLPAVTPTAGTVALRGDGTGYLYATYFNQSSPNNENTVVSQVFTADGSGDGFLRKVSLAHFVSSLTGTATINITGSAAALGGLFPSASGLSNTVVIRDGSGHVYSNYFNALSPNNENPGVSQVFVGNGSDGFLRKASIVHFTSSLSGTAPINITGSAASASNATTATNQSGGTVNATTGAFSGRVTVNNGAHTTRTDLGSGLSTITPNGASSNVQSAAVSGNASVAIPANVADGQTIVTRISNSLGSAVTITFNASYRMPNGVKSFSLNGGQTLLTSIVNVAGVYFATAASNMS